MFEAFKKKPHESASRKPVDNAENDSLISVASNNVSSSSSVNDLETNSSLLVSTISSHENSPITSAPNDPHKDHMLSECHATGILETEHETAVAGAKSLPPKHVVHKVPAQSAIALEMQKMSEKERTSVKKLERNAVYQLQGPYRA